MNHHFCFPLFQIKKKPIIGSVKLYNLSVLGEKTERKKKKKLSCVAVNHRDDIPDCEISDGGHAVVQINLGSEER